MMGHMQKRTLFLFILPFLILALGVRVAQHRQAQQEVVDTSQEKLLNVRFTSVKLENGRIVMTPKTRFGKSFAFRKPKAVSVGDTFDSNDHHWHCKYKIIGADNDGVVIHYDYSGELPAREGRWSGTVRIPLK